MTDLTQFDTRQKAHEGVDVPLVIDGETIYGDDKEPIVFKVKGASEPSVNEVILKTNRTSQNTPKEVLEADMKLARVALAGWSDNFTVEGEKPEFSPSGIAKVMANPTIRAVVLASVFEAHRFMNGS